MYLLLIAILTLPSIIETRPCINGWTTINVLENTKNAKIKRFTQLDQSNEFVVSIDNAKVLEAGIIITNTGKILADTTVLWNKSIDQHPLVNKEIDEEEIIFNGTLAVLASVGQQNYYHWMFQILPRLELLQKSGIKYDKLYFYDIHMPFQIETLKTLGINQEDIIIGKRNTVITADKLVVPSIPVWPSKGKNFAPWVQDFLNKNFVPEGKEIERKKVYVSRANATLRRILNEEEFFQFLEKEGFEMVHLEKLSVSEQASLFNQASIIIGSHGAGLTNLVFAPQNATIIEINSPENHRAPYCLLAKERGLTYYLYEPKIEKLSIEQKNDDDVMIDIADFKVFYDQL